MPESPEDTWGGVVLHSLGIVRCSNYRSIKVDMLVREVLTIWRNRPSSLTAKQTARSFNDAVLTNKFALEIAACSTTHPTTRPQLIHLRACRHVHVPC